MYPFILAVGVGLVATGFVTLIRRLHDRSVHEALAVLRHTQGDTRTAVTSFVGLLVPIVSSIAGGLAVVAVGLLGQAPAWLAR
jgi:hypothetical protein